MVKLHKRVKIGKKSKIRRHLLMGSGRSFVEGNVYADKSAIVLDWLLRVGINREKFSLREVVKEREVSLGLVQRVFGMLIFNGLLHSEGIRTAKKFFLKKPSLLLKSWLNQYSVVKKCKMWTYCSGFQGRSDLLKALKQSDLSENVALALHSAAEAYGHKNTNLDTLELYILEPHLRPKIEKALQLEPQERGYEVLLIEPYYESLLLIDADSHKNIKVSSPLLTFLDLYHFPLRGEEQAEFMAERIPELKRIYTNGS